MSAALNPAARTADVLVVGGGLVGAAVAWGLLREGLSVIVVDEGDVALRASRGNFGLVWVQGKGAGMPAYARWTRRSADLWTDFSRQLHDESGISPGYDKPGGLYFFLSEEEAEQKREQHRRMHNVNGALGYGAQMLDRQELAELVPGIGPDVVAGAWSPHDGHANPLHLLRGLHTALQKRGGLYRADARAQKVWRDGDGFAVQTAGGVYRAARIVLAAGHGNSTLGPMLDLHIPLKAQKGQILVTERTRPILKMPSNSIRQTGDGTIMIGNSHEDTGYSTDSVSSVMSELAANALRCLPALASLRIVRSWGAVRILSPDGAPIYQESATMPGAWSVNCHSGVTLAACHAGPLARMIASGSLNAEIDSFSTARFDQEPIDGQTH